MFRYWTVRRRIADYMRLWSERIDPQGTWEVTTEHSSIYFLDSGFMLGSSQHAGRDDHASFVYVPHDHQGSYWEAYPDGFTKCGWWEWDGTNMQTWGDA